MVKVPCARDKISGDITFAPHALKKRKYTCLDCDDDVVVRKGKKRIAHFSHLSAIKCSGESVMHKSTKQWIQTIVNDPEFVIWTQCYVCLRTFDVVRGCASLGAVVECWAKPHRIDVALFKNNKIAAFVEVFHTHATSMTKRVALESTAGWQCPVTEIKAINLVEAEYPKRFRCMTPRRCSVCLKRAIAKRVSNMTLRYTRFFRNGFNVTNALKRVNKSVVVDTLDQVLDDYVNLLEQNVEKFAKKWLNKFRAKRMCQICFEVRSSGKWCRCKRASMTKCRRCKKWVSKSATNVVLPLPGEIYPSRACRECSKQCAECSSHMVGDPNYPFNNKCFRCCYKKKYGTEWSPQDDGHPDGFCVICKKYIKTIRFMNVCFACNN